MTCAGNWKDTIWLELDVNYKGIDVNSNMTLATPTTNVIKVQKRLILSAKIIFFNALDDGLEGADILKQLDVGWVGS